MGRVIFKSIATISVFAGLLFLFATCSKDKSTSNIPDDDIIHEDIRGECLNNILSEPLDSGYMILEVVGDDLHIHHMEAYYNCCMEFAVGYDIDNSDITAFEFDVSSSPCLCDCFFNLQSILCNLDNGLYNITLIGIYGDTVAVDTVTIGG